MHLLHSGPPEPSPIWLLPGQDVLCSIWDIPGMISRDSISSPNVLGTGFAGLSSGCGLMTSGTFNSVLPYFLFLSRKQSAASCHPGCVNSSSFIIFSCNLSMHCSTVFEIVPITQPCSSSLLSLPCSISLSSSPSSSLPELGSSLRLSPIGSIISSNISLGSLDVNPLLSALLISFCSCLSAVSASSTRFHATAVSLST